MSNLSHSCLRFGLHDSYIKKLYKTLHIVNSLCISLQVVQSLDGYVIELCSVHVRAVYYSMAMLSIIYFRFRLGFYVINKYTAYARDKVFAVKIWKENFRTLLEQSSARRPLQGGSIYKFTNHIFGLHEWTNLRATEEWRVSQFFERDLSIH